MSGFENDIVFAKNADFTQADNQLVSESNGLFVDGQLWIGRTSVNAGGTHIDVHTLTPGTGISIVNGPGSITISNTGTIGGITTINGDVGSISGSTVTFADTYQNGSLRFRAITATQMALDSTDGHSNTAYGLQAAVSLLIGGTGTNNVAVGDGAIGTVVAGSNNISIGHNSLPNLEFSGSPANWNIGIGSGVGSNYSGAESSNILLNSLGVNGESNTLRIGAATGTADGQLSKAFISGISGVNVGSVASVVSISGDQLGSTTITAGTGITITPGANTITLAASGGGIAWSVITADQTAVVNNGYIANKGSALLLALPATAAIGDIIRVTGINTALGWKITQAANQQIFFGNTSTTLGATGFLQSNAIRDSIEMVCVVAGASTVWNILSSVGNITVS